MAIISHEIRTPMNGIIGMVDLLLLSELSKSQRENIETINESGAALMVIINDILDFSKIDAGKMGIDTIDFDLKQLVQDLVKLTSFKINKEIDLGMCISPEVHPLLQGDPGRIRQIITNLLGNATKFTKKGSITLRVLLEEDLRDSCKILIEVLDTGIGVSQDQKDGLFKAFTQADMSTTRKYGGTGLGLTISKRLVELMGGAIGFESDVGKGSRFWFRLELKKQILKKEISNYSGISEKRILSVGDQAELLETMDLWLVSWGCTPDHARSAHDAQQKIRDGFTNNASYDLALINHLLPGLDGIELARCIKSDTTLAGLPLILLASRGMKGDANEAKGAGIAAYLTNPVTPLQLYETIQRVLCEKREERDVELLTKYKLTQSDKNMHVLLAEDNRVNQMVAKKMLIKLGHHVDIVTDGNEAVTQSNIGKYDLILMDLKMPNMGGLEATKIIREREVDGEHISIVALTANAMPEDKQICLDAGMDDYLSKPLKIDELRATLIKYQMI